MTTEPLDKIWKYFGIGLMTILIFYMIGLFLWICWLFPWVPLIMIATLTVPVLVGWVVIKLTGEDGW